MTTTVETAVKERPTTLYPHEIRNALRSRGGQFRRVAKPQPNWSTPRERPAASPEGWQIEGHSGIWSEDGDAETEVRKCPYMVGMRLWVREPWALHPDYHPQEAGVIYRATDPGWDANNEGIKWRNAMFMPRWAARLTLEITEIRVERVADISEEDAIAEGCEDYCWGGYDFDFNIKHTPTVANFHRLWDSINGKKPGCSWADNPWVWVIGFKMIESAA